MYVPQRVLITGGAGFIASHICIKLIHNYENIQVVCLDKLDACSSIKNIATILEAPNFTFVKGNILCADLLRFLFETYQFDTVVHAAAQTHVDNSFGNSYTFTKNNVMGTHILIEVAKTFKVERFIHVSTDEVYGTVSDDRSRIETDALEPTNPYAATKAAAENLVKSYYYSFNLPVIITRGNNVYGPHQYPEKLIPKFICRLRKALPCCIHGSGENSRHFIFVSDVADAFLKIIQSGSIGNTYNIGSEDEFTNLEIAEKIIRIMKPEGCAQSDIQYVEDRAFNDVRYFIDSEKLLNLGWKPMVSFEDGLKRTIEWYSSLEEPYWTDTSDVCLAAHPKAMKY